MHKIILLLVIAYSSVLNAQFEVSPIFGIGISNINGTYTSSERGYVDFEASRQYGIAVQKSILKYCMASFELKKVQMGFVQTIAPTFWNVHVSNKYEYTSVAIFAKALFGKGTIGGYLMMGPRLSFGTGNISMSNAEINETRYVAWDDRGFSKTDFGFEMGSGLRFKIWKGALCMDFRYYLGLNNIHRADPEISIYNKSSHIFLSYFISINN